MMTVSPHSDLDSSAASFAAEIDLQLLTKNAELKGSRL
jgi:hypothetical protein